MDKIRLIIVSEDPSSRRGLTAIFASEGVFDILGGFSLTEINEKASVYQPDAIIVDIPNDFLKYKDEIKLIKRECPFSLVLALVDGEQCNEFLEVLAESVDGCVAKGTMRGCLVKAVELSCRAGLFCMPQSIKKIFSFEEGNKTRNNDFYCGDALTKREMEILKLMAKNLTNREIADALYISEPTVKTHVSNILRKLGQENRAQAIVYSFKNGLLKSCAYKSHSS